MKTLFVFCCLTVFLTSFSDGGRQGQWIAAVLKDTTPVYDMKQYWLALLYRGSNRTQDSVRAARIQKAHLDNIERLHRQGKIIMAGPMGSNGNLRGIFIMDAKDSLEAASYINTDSAVISGRLRFELYPWWTAKGRYEFK
jgi:uncharacterized protein YciI